MVDVVPSLLEQLGSPALSYVALRNVVLSGVIPVQRNGRNILIRIQDVPKLANAYASRPRPLGRGKTNPVTATEASAP